MNDTELIDLDSLRQQADELNKKVAARQAALDRAKAEFDAIPGNAEEIRRRLNDIELLRKALAVDLKEQYKRAYRDFMYSNTPHAASLMNEAVRLNAERPWREEVYSEMETEARQELADLHEANKRLSKALGRPRQNLK